ncbi:sucrose-6-phosphate hydrolase [Vibrio ishigakensis]|uniref:Sucrose-6-phosphate hydrolase n=1 Tax=Vibrio ishigakensis TaxID=1481914 RepID=A0A0B8QC78_9VIBR|nr:sucrose-6-phosphate hydrolase [Vibrio ishigakensis]
MVVSCGQHIEFYRSTNLIDWTLVSEFGYRHGAHSKGLGSAQICLSLRLKAKRNHAGF